MRWLNALTGSQNDPVCVVQRALSEYPSELMKIWPISTRVNKPENDHPAILEAVEVEDDSTLLL